MAPGAWEELKMFDLLLRRGERLSLGDLFT